MVSPVVVSRPQLGKYGLIAEIARGGMGVVYLAQTTGPGGFEKLAVVKQLKPELADDEKFLGMFMDEARLAARLNHRNVVQTNEVGEDEGRYFMAMEYLEGKTLQSVRSKLKPRSGTEGPKDSSGLSTAMILRIACEALAGLHYAHELSDYDGTKLGIVHRDISPQNIFITYDGQVKLLDFGVAKALGRTQETEVGMLKGRVVCMSPEQVANDSVDRRADIFSMGIVLRETLTGKRVWDNLGEMDVIKALLAKDIPPLPEDTDVPSDIRKVIEKAMAPNRDQRYATAHQMRVELEAIVARLDPGGSLTHLGEMISTEFAEHRQRVKVMIDKHRAGLASVEEELPILPLSSPEINSRPSASRPQTFASHPSARMSSGDLAVTAETAAPNRSNTLIAAAMIGGAILLVGSASLYVLRSQPQQPIAAASPDALAVNSPAGAVTATTPTPPTAEVVELTVRTTPSNAQIFVDDAAVAENPFRAKFPRGGQHTIRVVAPGHTPRIETVSLTESMSFSVSLEKLTAAPAFPAAPPRKETSPEPKASPSVPTTTPTEFTPRRGRAPQHSIDEKNPYGG